MAEGSVKNVSQELKDVVLYSIKQGSQEAQEYGALPIDIVDYVRNTLNIKAASGSIRKGIKTLVDDGLVNETIFTRKVKCYKPTPKGMERYEEIRDKYSSFVKNSF